MFGLHQFDNHFYRWKRSIWWLRRKKDACVASRLLSLHSGPTIAKYLAENIETVRFKQKCTGTQSENTASPCLKKIKPWFHITIFLKSVCWKILKLNTHPACCFFSRTLIVSNRCSSICFTVWQVHLSSFPLHIPLVKIMNKLQGNDKCVDNQDETQMKWKRLYFFAEL